MPSVARSRVWHIDRIEPEEELEIFDRKIDLEPQYLSGLNEAELGRVDLCLVAADEELARVSFDIRVLARDEWGGFASGPELLAAFVMPNDPAVARLMKKAGDTLGQHGHSTALDGYQSRDLRRAYMLAAAAWSAVAAEKLTYSNPPSSFEKSGQKTRRPSVVLQNGLATCLDSTLLFASLIEGIGLNSVIVFQQGHCFAGVWLADTTLKHLIETDVSEVRKAITAKELIVFETTLITQSPPARFQDAQATAVKSLNRENDARFVAAVDIARARLAQIRPLASHESNENQPTVADNHDSGTVPLPKVPDLPDHRRIDQPEELPTTPRGRIERWQSKLLDLSLRNRLLSFKDSKQVVPFVCPDVPQLEDALASGKKVRLISLPEENPVGERDEALHQRANRKDLNTEFARLALARNELASPLSKKELDGRLIELYRKTKNDLAEGGSNTLFLAAGFLSWRRAADNAVSYQAPLLLVPVKLVRATAASPFCLASHEDDVCFNATLIQMLKKDFGCDLTALESNLPTDQNGVDVSQVFEMVRRAVRQVPGFEVVDETALSTFTFAKYLMWKDLTDRLEQLTQNRVVRHLVQNPDKEFQPAVSTPFPRNRDIDRKYPPGQLVHPLPADSSQLAAIAAADAGHDFVLIGPPGTGKSQTIANLIANCLASRKTVLFVAEKTAALDVVYRRLKNHGLGDYCLELHSNKAERKSFLTQLTDAWKANEYSNADRWLEISDRMRIRRDQLNVYVDALHEEHSNGWSVFRAMGVSVKGGSSTVVPQIDWPPTIKHDKSKYQELVRSIEELSLTRKEVGAIQKPPFLTIREWSAVREKELFQEAAILRKAVAHLRHTLHAFAYGIGVADVSDSSSDKLQVYSKVAKELIATATENFGIIFHKHFAQLSMHVDSLESSIRVLQKETALLKAEYSETVLMEIPIDEIEKEWRAANTKFWPLSLLAKRRVQKLLQTYASSGMAEPATDLAAIRNLQQEIQRIDASPLANQPVHWKGRDSDPAKMRSHLAKGKELKQAVIELGKHTGQLNVISQKLHPVLGRDSSSHPVTLAAKQFLAAINAFAESVRKFRNVAGGSPITKGSQSIIEDVENQLATLDAGKSSLRKWIEWHEITERVTRLGLSSFVAAMESGTLTPEEAPAVFQLAYVRWWLPTAIDSSDALRRFQRYKHEDAIREFRDLDDEARVEASLTVRRELKHQLPDPNTVPRQSELGILRHQAQLQRPSKTIRELIRSMPTSFGKLALSSDVSLSIAQYLPPDQAIFDVVIFDEASQITTWDAIGAIARGRQTIIVGDPKQLPPTNFFGRTEDDASNDEMEDHEKDLESILDEVKASGIPTMQLNWHYRSSHESLIAFSNYHYYGNELITFPSAVTADLGVSLKYQPKGSFDRGRSRTNREEARAIVSDAVGRMKRWMKLTAEERPTLGVITFNSQQQSLVMDLFDQARRNAPEIEWFFDDSRIEPTVVKNLENVQGDERDVMLFSIAFGPDATGKISLNFGALNRAGGERRLNVAVTRARKELVVYSSFRADQLNADGAKHIGVRHLKEFLDYAERGPVALHGQAKGSMGGFDSPFEEAVSEQLQSRGWQVVSQIGVSAFRIDLGVVHPDKPGTYLAGIECDGATYHRSATAQDRDKIREQVLRHLGWEIVRIWSTDWWADSDAAAERLHIALTDLLGRKRENDRLRDEQEAAEQTESEWTDDEVSSTEEVPEEEPVSEIQHDTDRLVRYRPFDGDGFTIQPEAFFDKDYTETLKALTLAALEKESPIREDILCQRIARLHNISRTTSRVRDRVLFLIPQVASTDESSGRFLWYPGTPIETTDYRHPDTEESRRSVDQISLAELCDFAISHNDILKESNSAVGLARKLGIARLSASARDRLQEAVNRAAELFVERSQI
ncbi:MAG: DUF3320 domain-containing protein [Planctomycetaceae bacterium]